MRYGLFTSVILHVAILAWAIFSIQTQPELRMAEPEPIVTGLVTESDLTRLRQGVRTAKELEAEPREAPKSEPARKEAAKPKPVAAAPPPAPAEPPPPPPREKPKEEPKAASPPPPPAPTPDEQKKLVEMLKEEERRAEDLLKKIEEQRKAEEQQKAEEQRQAEAQRKAEEHKRLEEEKKRKEAEARKTREEERKKRLAELKKKQDEEKKRKEAEAKKQFDAAKIAALLNKVPDKGAPRPSVPLDEQAKSLVKGPVLGAPEGRDQKLTASELAVLQQIIRSCIGPKWSVLGGGETAQNTVVRIRVQFNPDGTLAAAPQVMNPQNSAFFLAASESALRAVQACEPYPLPPAKYEVWRDTVLTLNPRDMF